MTTRRWRSPRAAHGNASSGISARSAPTSSAATSRVAGIGDMAGDVFGNGMLQSPQIRLVAAFNHQHIFIDPQPDAARSLRERDAAVRAAALQLGRLRPRLPVARRRHLPAQPKAIALSRGGAGSARARRADTPNECIRAILRLPVDLLWNGGIGTYVKASGESHADVGDRSNDARARRRTRPALQSRRRGRQPRPHPARARRVRAARRPAEHGLHRQFGGRRTAPTSRSTSRSC